MNNQIITPTAVRNLAKSLDTYGLLRKADRHLLTIILNRITLGHPLSEKHEKAYADLVALNAGMSR